MSNYYNGKFIAGSSTTTEASGADWGNIVGDIDRQTDLKNRLDSKVDITELDNYYDKTATDDLLDEKQNNLTFDNSPIEGSTNPVTSGGIRNFVDDELALKQDILVAGSGILIDGVEISVTKESAKWGQITGDISDQTDLRSSLDTKVNTSTLLNYYNKTEVDGRLNAKQNTLTFDDIPEYDSDNPVTSDGIRSYIDSTVGPIVGQIPLKMNTDMQNISDIAKQKFLDNVALGTKTVVGSSIQLESGAWVLNNSIQSNTTFILPNVKAGILNQIKINFTTQVPSPTISWGTSLFFNGNLPEVFDIGNYTAYWEYDPKGGNWICGVMKLG